MKFGWLRGLTTAAVFVLALSLVVNQQQHQPDVGNGIQTEELSSSRVESMAEKQLAPGSGQLRQNLKESKDERVDQPVPSAAPPVNAPQEQALGGVVQEPRSPASDDLGQLSDAATVDVDSFVLPKTMEAEKTGLQAPKPRDFSTQIGVGNELPRPAIVAEPSPPDAESRSNLDDQAEAQLRVIINLKQAGDERWKSELKTFIENHPDYPLPDELKN